MGTDSLLSVSQSEIVDDTVCYRLSGTRSLVEFHADESPSYKHRGFNLVFLFARLEVVGTDSLKPVFWTEIDLTRG